MKKLTLLLALGLCLPLMAGPALAADAPADEPPTPSAEDFLAWLEVDAPASPDEPARPAEGPERFDAIGCTAEYNCVHGTIVSCSASVPGTCISSGGGCGQVTCNGVTTRCPGYCLGDHHCLTFCMAQGSFDGYCDWGGCCVCL